MSNNYYTSSVKRDIEETKRLREQRKVEERERIRQKTQAYNNMNYYSSSSEQKKMYEVIWKSL